MAEFRAWKLALENSEARPGLDAPGFDAAQAKDIVSATVAAGPRAPNVPPAALTRSPGPPAGAVVVQPQAQGPRGAAAEAGGALLHCCCTAPRRPLRQPLLQAPAAKRCRSPRAAVARRAQPGPPP
jgi:hypothetical protein